MKKKLSLLFFGFAILYFIASLFLGCEKELSEEIGVADSFPYTRNYSDSSGVSHFADEYIFYIN